MIIYILIGFIITFLVMIAVEIERKLFRSQKWIDLYEIDPDETKRNLEALDWCHEVTNENVLLTSGQIILSVILWPAYVISIIIGVIKGISDCKTES